MAPPAPPASTLQNLSAWAVALAQYKDPNGNPYNFITVHSELQEAALKGTDMNTVMDKGKVQFLRNLDGERDRILADLSTQHNSPAFQQNDQGPGDKLEGTTTYNQAQQAVNGIHDEIAGIITNWFNQMTPVLADYEKDIQNNQPTVSIAPTQYHSQTQTVHKLGTTAQETTWSGVDSSNGWKYVISGGQDVWGNKQNGFVLGNELDGPSFDPQGNVGLLSNTENIGGNISGHYYGVSVSEGLQAGLGVSLDHGIQVNLPFISVGLTFGGPPK